MHARCAKSRAPKARLLNDNDALNLDHPPCFTCGGFGTDDHGHDCYPCGGQGTDPQGYPSPRGEAPWCAAWGGIPPVCARVQPTRKGWVEQLRRDLPYLSRGDDWLSQQVALCLATAESSAWDLVLALGHVARRPFTDEERKAVAAALAVPTAPEIPRLGEVSRLARAMPEDVRAEAMAQAERVAGRLLGRVRDLARVQDKRHELPMWASDWSDLCCDRADLEAILRALDFAQDEVWSPPLLRHLDAEAGAVDQEGLRVSARQRARRERESNPCAWWGL